MVDGSSSKEDFNPISDSCGDMPHPILKTFVSLETELPEALFSEMKEFLIIENHNEYQAAEKWASDAVDAIGKQLGEQKVREVAIGLLIIELHRAGTFMLRGCVNEAVYERFNAEMA